MELEDDAYKIFFNTQGKNGCISKELKELPEYIQTSKISKECTNPLIKDMDRALQMARSNEEWRNDYMTLELLQFEKYEEGRQETAALLSLILTEAQKQNVSVNYEQLQNTDYVQELCRKLEIQQ